MSIYDEAFLWIYLTDHYFRCKSSITDVCSTGLCIGPQKYWNLQSEDKVEQIIATVTVCSVSCFKFVCFPWRCVGNFPLMNMKMKLDSKRFKRKNLVLIFWNFLFLCTNIKSCVYSPESQNKFWSTPTFLWAGEFFWPSTDAHSPIVSFFTWLYIARPVHRDIWLVV